jgi:subtilisin family serine protease
VAALLLQAHPEATAAQIRDALRASGSQAAAPNNLLGWGIVNAPAAEQILEDR